MLYHVIAMHMLCTLQNSCHFGESRLDHLMYLERTNIRAYRTFFILFHRDVENTFRLSTCLLLRLGLCAFCRWSTNKTDSAMNKVNEIEENCISFFLSWCSLVGRPWSKFCARVNQWWWKHVFPMSIFLVSKLASVRHGRHTPTKVMCVWSYLQLWNLVSI